MQDFCRRGVYECLRREMSSAADASPKGGRGILPQKILKKMGYLRPHFVRFEDSSLGNKPYKGEGSKNNNSGKRHERL